MYGEKDRKTMTERPSHHPSTTHTQLHIYSDKL